MALRDLTPGLPPDEVEKLRWQTFGHKKAHRVETKEAFLRFTQKRRFVLLRPIPGTHYPSVLEAAVGRPLLDFMWDERTRKLEDWKNQAIRSRLLVSTAVLANQQTLVSPMMLADFLAAREYGDDLDDPERRCARSGVGPEVTSIVRKLAASGALPESELQALLRASNPATQRRLRQALHEARAQLLIVETDYQSKSVEDQNPVYDLLTRAFKSEVAKVAKTRPSQARQRIACRYLRNVLVEGTHEMARLLCWPPEQTLAACQALVRKRMALSHPASRHNRHLFQATSTDLLEGKKPEPQTDAGI